jgi:urease accessory protein
MAAPRAKSVVQAAQLGSRTSFDHIVLPHDGRHRRRITMRTEGDFVFLLDLAEATHLKHGDGLLLEDGRIIGVIAAEERVAEIFAGDSHHLARIAWHVGNRHVPAEILADRIRIMPDPIIEDMARGLGGTVERVEARFEPEGGAYEQAAAHGHAHHHDHTHHDHHGHADHDDHGHGHAHDHDHHHGHRHHGKSS